MKRIAIIGGGISGLTAAYELEQARKRGAAIDWHLYEASDRLGGIVETTRHTTQEGEWILEGGPDGWVSEKPWARDLAIELGLESDLIYSNDATRKTYIYLDGRLQALPDRMRMMVPEDLATLETSPLFSTEAKRAYADELANAARLKAESPFADEAYDESVAAFVRRHFGDEVLTKLAAPLLSGVFGGDVERLSVRAVMAPFVAMEQQHGSLIAALQQRKRERGNKPPQPIFTSLRRGVGSLVESLIAQLSKERITHDLTVWPLLDAGWRILAGRPDRTYLSFVTTYRTRSKTDIFETFDHILIATPLDVARSFAGPAGIETAKLLPHDASSAVLAAFCWPAELAHNMTIPPGFGVLIPPNPDATGPELLAATFVDQKFPHRAPNGAHILRAFFGTGSAENFANSPDEDVAQAALSQMRAILGPLPEPDHALTSVRRWPRSLPQYEVGHLERMAELDKQVAAIGDLHLLGNSYRGVGLPDLIRDARAAARAIVEQQ